MKPDIVIVQHTDHFLVVFDGAVVIELPADPALIQKIVVGYRDNLGAFLPGRLKLFFHPVIGLPANHAPNAVDRIILAGIQH